MAGLPSLVLSGPLFLFLGLRGARRCDGEEEAWGTSLDPQLGPKLRSGTKLGIRCELKYSYGVALYLLNPKTKWCFPKVFCLKAVGSAWDYHRARNGHLWLGQWRKKNEAIAFYPTEFSPFDKFITKPAMNTRQGINTGSEISYILWIALYWFWDFKTMCVCVYNVSLSDVGAYKCSPTALHI